MRSLLVIQQIKEGDINAAIAKIGEVNSLPAVCGRVCPQEEQCEKYCVLAKKGEVVGIGRLERYVADYSRAKGQTIAPLEYADDAQKVAVVGSGPAGLTAAGDLAKMGHKVTVFEALHLPGGVLMYGIPEFRLPKDKVVQAEINNLRKFGVDIVVNAVIGSTFTVDELSKKKALMPYLLVQGLACYISWMYLVKILMVCILPMSF